MGKKRVGTWLRIIPVPHDCPVPGLDEITIQAAGPGSQWQCAECGMVWEYTAHPDGLWMRVSLHGW